MSAKWTKARKAHVCDLCFEKIEKGENYHRQDIMPWDHPDNECFFTFKAHVKCYEIWLVVGADYYWDFPPNKSEWDVMKNSLTPEEKTKTNPAL